MTVFAKRTPVEIVKGEKNDRVKLLFQPVTTTVLPNAKLPDSLSSIYVTTKQSPVTTD